MQTNEVVTGKVRFSFCNLLKARAMQPGQEEKYSTTILVPKSDVATKARIDAAILAAKTAGKDKFGGVIPPIVATPVYDGDGVRPSDGMPFGDECKGHWVFTASNKLRPEIVDINRNPIIDGSEIYSGMYGRVSVQFFAYNNSGRKGIGCSLGPVQKLADGEPLGGSRTSAEDAFGDGGGFIPQTQPQYQPPKGYGQQQPPVQPQPPYVAPNAPGAFYGQQPPVQQQYAPQPQQQFDPITGQPVAPIYGI